MSNAFCGIPVVFGDLGPLPSKVKEFVAKNIEFCKPDNLHISDGSPEEGKLLIEVMLKQGLIEPLPKYENCWLVHTDQADVARVEEKTFICTEDERESHPILKPGVKGKLGNWMSPADLKKAVDERFPGCMRGRTMHVIPFSMGPLGSPLSKIGIELTDSPYVVACMRIMTRISPRVLQLLGNGHFVRCLHSVGEPYPLERPLRQNWPCNPEKTLVLHLPHTDEIVSFGSGYGGNSLLGKKCFALRIGSTIARSEGWFAEHMLILGITDPTGEKRYITGAFPSACGKTNLAMITPVLKGYYTTCVGDDIAWMRFDVQGALRAINPENGFFGVAPGTSWKSNPIAMKTIFRNTVFTNVAKTSDGGVYWEGMGEDLPSGVTVTSWLKEAWTPSCGKPAAHPNSRFTSPCAQCPMLDSHWEDPDGVPVCAMLFGGRRPSGVPLVYEAFDWTHGVFIAACMKSEATAAAEFHGKEIMHDPFAMRPFFGYNFGHYLRHWLSFKDKPSLKLPRIFHVNWFRKDKEGNFLWPGFGENSRVLDWIIRRVRGEDVAQETCIGYIPKLDSLNMEGLEDKNIDLEELFRIPKDYWLEDIEENRKYFEEQVGADLPQEIWDELEKLKARVMQLP